MCKENFDNLLASKMSPTQKFKDTESQTIVKFNKNGANSHFVTWSQLLKTHWSFWAIMTSSVKFLEKMLFKYNTDYKVYFWQKWLQNVLRASSFNLICHMTMFDFRNQNWSFWPLKLHKLANFRFKHPISMINIFSKSLELVLSKEVHMLYNFQ